LSDSKPVVLLQTDYVCVRCGTRTSQTDLEALSSPRCASCGFTVFGKARSQLIKQVRAV
jgi:DNA-directed RNA polymerase subunit RPC12/RpoP